MIHSPTPTEPSSPSRSIRERVVRFLKEPFAAPLSTPWRGGLLGGSFFILLWFLFYILELPAGRVSLLLLIGIACLLAPLGALILGMVIHALYHFLPRRALAPLLVLAVLMGLSMQLFFHWLMAVALFGLFFGLFSPKSNHRFAEFLRRLVIFLCAGAFLAGAVWTLYPVPAQERRPIPEYIESELTDPSVSGGIPFQALSYSASGEEGALVSRTVNASTFMGAWKQTLLRRLHNPTDLRALPLNANVWLPEGEGPFPVALILHGNHESMESSHNGYEYIGALLASQGFLTLSIDENFLNSSLEDYLSLKASSASGENAARAFVLLEHIRLLAEWNTDANSAFYQKVDTQNIALIGHSRGGEAVALAAAMSRLSLFPNNGTQRLHYPYGIKAVVAIAPTDGQYTLGGAPLALPGDIHYLTLHGSMDMDVKSFMGVRTYEQIHPTGDTLKAYLYVQGANHGFFNTDWDKHDGLALGLNRLAVNDGTFIRREEQEKIAQVYISAFLHYALLDETEWEKLFIHPGYGMEWLPQTGYIWNWQKGDTQMLASYEEDIDLTTGTAPGTKILVRGMSQFLEKNLPNKLGKSTNRAAYLSWKARDSETTQESSIELELSRDPYSGPEYRLTFSTPLDIRETGLFRFSAATTKDEPIEYLLLFEGEKGSAFFTSEELASLCPPFENRVYKKPFEAQNTAAEPVLQCITVPGARLNGIGAIRTFSIRFSNGVAGDLYLDDIGYAPGS